MANNNQPNKTMAGTNVSQVRQQNAQSAQGANRQFGTEFGSETDAQAVRQQNQQAEARKAQNSGAATNMTDSSQTSR